MKKTITTKVFFWGLAGSCAMVIFYLTIMFLTMSSREVLFNFLASWYLITGIVVGFGIQIGLWVYVKNCGTDAHGIMPGTSGATSGVGMVACCAHHLAGVLPILGVSGATIFLAQYQRPLLILGLSINVFSIAYMLHLLQKHKKFNNHL